MNERIKELAEQCGAFKDRFGNICTVDFDLERFAELVAADEREACAKVCEPQEEHDDPLTAWKIAAAIRARGNT